MEKIKKEWFNCGTCKIRKEFAEYKERKGKRYKTCIKCREKKKKYLCEHGRSKYTCKECGGSQICSHNRLKVQCKECKGTSICEHNRRKNECKECGGSSICEHGRVKHICKECGGASICEHGRERRRCKECGGNGICEHDRERNKCKECDFSGYLSSNIRSMVYQALKRNKKLSSKKYLCCDILTFREHIEKKFKEDMTWDNYGKKWHIDHIIPLKYKKPSLEEVIERLHYTNTQPMWAKENLRKGNRYIG